MAKIFKYLPKIIILNLLLVTLLTGCWNSRQLNALTIVAGLGIDKVNGQNDIKLTAQIVKPSEMKKSSKDGSGGSGSAYLNISSTSFTIFDAIREFTHETSNKLYLAHTQTIIFGKAAAENGVRQYIDFFVRSHETRPTIIILISMTSANELLDIKPETEKLPAMNMAKLAKEQGLLTSHAIPVNLQEFTARLLSKTTSAIAPIVSGYNENGKKAIRIMEMAVFKSDKLVGSINQDETRGLLWAIGKVKGGTINVDLPGGYATLEISSAQGKIIPEIKNGKPLIKIKIKEASNLVNQTGTENLATLPGFSRLKSLQNDVIKQEIRNSLKKAKELGTDYFGFGDAFHKKYRKEWKQMEDKWDAIFPTIQVDIEIESNIQAAGLIVKPITPESQSKKE